MENGLHNIKDIYKLITENIQDVIYRYKLVPSHSFEYISPSIETVSGYPAEEYYSNPKLILKIIHPDDHKIYNLIKDSSLNKPITIRLISKNGNIIWIELRNKLTYNSQGILTLIEGSARNITDRKILEEKVLQAQKLELIGRLVSGVSHDFNNVLTCIMGWAEMLKTKYMDKLTEERIAIDAIIEGALMGSNMIKKLLNFASKKEYNPVLLNINKIIMDTVKINEKIFEKNIEVEYNFYENIETIKADECQIQQILTNLIINAKDAIPSKGNIIFKTENVIIDIDNTIMCQELEPGIYVKFSITDTGTGISNDIKDKIFEPFFTTKEDGKGTGLGLAIVYEIVKKLNGHINCFSKLGKGTTFSIYIPAFKEKRI